MKNVPLFCTSGMNHNLISTLFKAYLLINGALFHNNEHRKVCQINQNVSANVCNDG